MIFRTGHAAKLRDCMLHGNMTSFLVAHKTQAAFLITAAIGMGLIGHTSMMIDDDRRWRHDLEVTTIEASRAARKQKSCRNFKCLLSSFTHQHTTQMASTEQLEESLPLSAPEFIAQKLPQHKILAYTTASLTRDQRCQLLLQLHDYEYSTEVTARCG